MFRNINPCSWALGLKQIPINLHVDGVSIEQLKSIKWFDVHLDSELSFSEHVNSVLQKG